MRITCDTCGKRFSRKPSHIQEHNFCSQRCYGQWRSEQMSGQQLVEYHEAICQGCGRVFEVVPSRSDTASYCSAECRKRRVTKPCAWCSKPVTRYAAKANQADNAFCNMTCYAEWRKTLTGKRAPRWLGGKAPYYGPSWFAARRKALKRDNHTCQHCGKTRDEMGQNPDVHHIVPFRLFGVDRHKEANSLSNLICLCRSCHGIADRGNPSTA